MPRTGRPKKQIDKEQFEKLCGLLCTEEEIASFFDCSVDTINNWCKSTYNKTFSDTIKDKSYTGKVSLRRFQFEQARKNPTMAIWLGKQWLGQKDNIEVSTDDEVLKTAKELLSGIHSVIK